MASTQSTIFNKPHECGSGCEACRLLVRSNFTFTSLSAYFERFKIAKIEVLRARAAENDLLRARIAELENAGAADDEPMQIADSDDDVKILEVFAPATAAVSNAAAAKKVRNGLLWAGTNNENYLRIYRYLQILSVSADNRYQ